MIQPRALQVPAFFTLALLAAAVAAHLGPQLATLPEGPVIALGMTVDWLLVLPLAFYGLVARPRGQALLVLPVVLVGWLVLHWVLPTSFHAPLEPFARLAPALELLVLGWIVVQVRAVRQAQRDAQRGDPAATEDLWRATRLAIDRALPNYRRAARILAFELLVLFYACGVWRTPLPESGPNSFTLHRRAGYGQLLAGLGLVALCELPLAHWLLARSVSPIAAWLATALSLYGVFFFLGDWQAARRRWVELGTSSLEVRVGLRWDFQIPYRQIAAVRELGPGGPQPGQPGLAAVLCGQPNVEIELDEDVIAHGPYGMERPTRRVRLRLDERAAFVAALREHLPEPRNLESAR